MRSKIETDPFGDQADSLIYKRMAREIFRRIKTGKFQEGDRLPSTRELAAEFKVHPMTSRQALKLLEQHGLVSMHVGRGTFVRPRKKAVLRVAFLLPNLGTQMPGDVSCGLREKIAEQGDIDLSIIDYGGDVPLEIEYLQRMRTGAFDGVIYFPTLDPATVQPTTELVKSGFPIVFIDRAIPDLESWLVTSDNYSIGELAAEHLIEAGVKNPACVTTHFQNVEERLAGFFSGLNNRNIALPDSRIKRAPLGGDPEGNLTRELLNMNPRPDGIFYYNDYTALFACRVIKSTNVVMPTDLKIIGCDDIEATRMTTPSLSSIRQDFHRIGRRALELLLEMIDLPEKQRLQGRHEKIAVQLIPRETTTTPSR